MKKLILLSTIPAFFLAGCSSLSTPTPLTLTSVQAEVSAIDTAIDEVYGVLKASLPSSVATYVADVDTAAAIIENLKTGTSVVSDIGAFSSDIGQVIAVLPLPPATKTAIDLGLAVVDAFASGATTSPVPAASLAFSAEVSTTPFGPPIVPIPLPLSDK